MPAEDVRNIFERVDAEPSAQFTETLLSQLRAEYLRASPDTSRDAARPTHEEEGTITVEALHDEPRARRGRGPERLGVRRSWRRIAVAAATAALIVATIALVRTASDDGGNVLTPAGPAPSAPAPAPSTLPPSTRPPLPRGLTLLPPEGATPSAPESGQLLASVPIPIWVYEDGRVISARFLNHDEWTGFLEQRLSPSGVELVRAEILALEPFPDCGAGAGNYGYMDGARTVGESPGGTDLCNISQYSRLADLAYGAPSWLPASAWLDPEPKPYVPSTYQVQISTIDDATEDPPIDTSGMPAPSLAPDVAELLTRPEPCLFPSFGPKTSCFRVTTAEARLIAERIGSVNSAGTIFGGYWFAFLPYLPHDAPVWCCGG